jgi:hypothetical protein
MRCRRAASSHRSGSALRERSIEEMSARGFTEDAT